MVNNTGKFIFFYRPSYMIVFTIVTGDTTDKDMQKMIKDIDEYMRVCENIKKQKKAVESRKRICDKL